jgi:hypothetical protein
MAQAKYQSIASAKKNEISYLNLSNTQIDTSD